MNIVGIIAEYNPFHNGHLYHISKIKEMYKDSLIVLVLSGNFLQRGTVSLLDKYEKTKISLEYGIDIVLELPFKFATQSADVFAHGALKILNEFKIDTLVFGSESNDVETLIKLANIQINNQNYNEKVKKLLDKGINYPTAMSKALKELTNVEISSPNDILALSYIKEIIKNSYKINPVSIKRTNNYHDIESNDKIISATNIRNKLNIKCDIKKFVPEKTYEILKNKNIKKMNDYYSFIKYNIISNIDSLDEYMTVDEGIENRIKKYIYNTNSYEELLDQVKNKRYTYNKVSRMLLHILTSFKKANNNNTLDYIRVLGLNDRGQEYLNSVKKKINVPLVTKFSDFDEKNRIKELKLTYIYNLDNINKIKDYIKAEIHSKIIFKNKND